MGIHRNFTEITVITIMRERNFQEISEIPQACLQKLPTQYNEISQ
jgi:hypothetical protein